MVKRNYSDYAGFNGVIALDYFEEMHKVQGSDNDNKQGRIESQVGNRGCIQNHLNDFQDKIVVITSNDTLMNKLSIVNMNIAHFI